MFKQEKIYVAAAAIALMSILMFFIACEESIVRGDNGVVQTNNSAAPEEIQTLSGDDKVVFRSTPDDNSCDGECKGITMCQFATIAETVVFAEVQNVERYIVPERDKTSQLNCEEMPFTESTPIVGVINIRVMQHVFGPTTDEYIQIYDLLNSSLRQPEEGEVFALGIKPYSGRLYASSGLGVAINDSSIQPSSHNQDFPETVSDFKSKIEEIKNQTEPNASCGEIDSSTFITVMEHYIDSACWE